MRASPEMPTENFRKTGEAAGRRIASLYNPDGMPTAAYAVFRINPDLHLPEGSGAYRGNEFATADNPNIAFAPQLNINIADTPEPATFILLAVGAVGMAGYGSVAAAFPHFTDGIDRPP